MNERIRIKDIALKAGVSKGTVDRVLHKRGNVSPVARAKVMEAMKELDYQPNVIASALAYNRSWKIAALIPQASDDPFWEQPINGIKRAVKSMRDYGLSIDFYHFKDADAKHFTEMGKQLMQREVDALLIAPSFSVESHLLLNDCAAKKIPFLQINTFLEREDREFLCYIGQDSYQSGVLAAKLLHFDMSEHDKAMILHLSGQVQNSMHLLEKEKGFQDYLKNHKKGHGEIVKASFENVSDKKKLRRFIEKKLAEEPDIKGIFVTNSKIFHIAELLEAMGRLDIKLVGFDLIEKNLNCLREGKIDFLINQNPQKQGFLGIMNIFNHLVLKKEISRMQHLPLDVVMKENMQYYEEREVGELHLII